MRTTALMRLSSFIGRQRELLEIVQLLRDERLVTLTGPGGSGKTRLALEASTRLVELFRDGVWVVDLATLNEGALVQQAIASTLGVRQAPGSSLADGLERFLDARTALLVLDNCEHLIAACAESVERLLRACPALRVLATSREALEVAGETTWPVPPLSLPDREMLTLEELLGFESPRLFVERALPLVRIRRR